MVYLRNDFDKVNFAHAWKLNWLLFRCRHVVWYPNIHARCAHGTFDSWCRRGSNVMRVLLSTYLVCLGLVQFFRLRLSVVHSRDQLCLHGWRSADWRARIMRQDKSRDTCGPVYSRQNELRSRWEKCNMFCRSNCTRYEKTSLMAFAAWTPACLVGSAQRWLVFWSTAAVLVLSRFRYRCTALGSLSTSDWCRVSRLSRSGRCLPSFLLVLAYP